MAGQATVVVNGNTWSVSVASTTAELTSGLSGVASIPAATGMLFDMGSDQNSITINMAGMLFSLDILFINSGGTVVGVLHGVAPGEAAAFDAGSGPGTRYFMEVNAGELAGVGIGDTVVISGYTPSAGIDLSQIVTAMIAIGMMGMVMRMMSKPLKTPLLYAPTREIPTYHSIHGPERERLVSQYGTWAVGRAEAVCPDDDVACVEREAVNLLAAYKKKTGGRYFYWSITNEETREIFEKGYPYTTQGRAVWGARAFASKNIPVKDPVTISIYDEAPPEVFEERGARTPVYESKWTRG